MERYAGQPVALLGINADADPEGLSQKPLPWPTIWDGPNGPLAAQLRVQAYPSLYLIDPAGQVRRTWTGLPQPGELEAAIDRLLAEPR